MEEVLGTQKPQEDDAVKTRTQSMAELYAKVERKNKRFIGGENEDKKVQLISQQEQYMNPGSQSTNNIGNQDKAMMEDDETSQSTVSLSSISDRSDLNEAEIDRIIK